VELLFHYYTVQPTHWGRSAIVKWKWVHQQRKCCIKNQPGFIKFALGENVKQANGESQIQLVSSRMGVEQVFTDYFQRAKDYDMEKLQRQW
jgi:hypothetical protein